MAIHAGKTEARIPKASVNQIASGEVLSINAEISKTTMPGIQISNRQNRDRGHFCRSPAHQVCRCCVVPNAIASTCRLLAEYGYLRTNSLRREWKETTNFPDTLLAMCPECPLLPGGRRQGSRFRTFQESFVSEKRFAETAALVSLRRFHTAAKALQLVEMTGSLRSYETPQTTRGQAVGLFNRHRDKAQPPGWYPTDESDILAYFDIELEF